MSKDPCLRPKFRPPAEIFFSYPEFPNFVKKTPKTNPRPKCIGGFHYRGNLQKIVSMPFGKGNYFFKAILEKKNYYFFFFFFFEFFEKKKHSCSRKKHSCSQILSKKTPKTNPRPKCIRGFHYRGNRQK